MANHAPVLLIAYTSCPSEVDVRPVMLSIHVHAFFGEVNRNLPWRFRVQLAHQPLLSLDGKDEDQTPSDDDIKGAAEEERILFPLPHQGDRWSNCLRLASSLRASCSSVGRVTWYSRASTWFPRFPSA
jgi:hypothetical protein